MQGIDSTSGQPLSNDQHLAQSLRDIVSTPLGSRVMRRDYGVDISLLAMPQTPSNLLKIFSKLATAIQRWEPRLTITRLQAVPQFNGQTEIIIDAKKTDGSTLSVAAPIGNNLQGVA